MAAAASLASPRPRLLAYPKDQVEIKLGVQKGVASDQINACT